MLVDLILFCLVAGLAAAPLARRLVRTHHRLTAIILFGTVPAAGGFVSGMLAAWTSLHYRRAP